MLRADDLPCCKKYVSSLFFKIWINDIHYFLLYTIFYASALLQGIWTRVSCHHARALLPGTRRCTRSAHPEREARSIKVRVQGPLDPGSSGDALSCYLSLIL